MTNELATQFSSLLLFDGNRIPSGYREDLSSLIPVLRRNRVPVAALPRASLLADMDVSGALLKYLRKEHERYERQRAAYTEIAAAWTNQEIEGILIKSPGYFPYTSSNLDVLVDSGQAGAACAILEAIGYSELTIAREPYKRLFRRLHSPHLGFPIHVHTAVAWINRFLTDADVLKGRRRCGDSDWLLYPSPENVFLITTAHWLYEDKELALRDLYHASLAVKDGVDWDYVRRRADDGGWRAGLELALALYRVAANRFGAHDLRDTLPTADVRTWPLRRAVARSSRGSSAPIGLSKSLGKALHFAKTAKDPHLSSFTKLRELSLLLSAAIRCKLPHGRNGPTFVVAIGGPDGAGKTTVAHALRDVLASEVGLSASYHWLRPGTSSGLEFIRPAGAQMVRIASRNRFRDPTTSVTSPGSRRMLLQTRPGLRAAWGCVLLTDFVVRLWARRIRCRMVGGIHIFDRYAVDAAVDLEAMYRFSNARLAIALTPSPAVQILLKPVADCGQSPSEDALPTILDDRLLELYGRHANLADAIVEGRQPIEALRDQVAQLVVQGFVRAGGAKKMGQDA